MVVVQSDAAPYSSSVAGLYLPVWQRLVLVLKQFLRLLLKQVLKLELKPLLKQLQLKLRQALK